MKYLAYSFLLLTCLISLVSCSGENSGITIGLSPMNLPVTLSLDSKGKPRITFDGNIYTPIGTISISSDVPDVNYGQHVTYIELLDRHIAKKHVIVLRDIGEQISWDSKECHIAIKNNKYSTEVIVDSDEISNLVNNHRNPGFKPDFPSHPYRSFAISGMIYSKVNWQVDSFSDFFADIICGLLLVLGFILDIFIFLILLAWRLIKWLYLLVAYIFRS